jgi:hypothetical protein
MSLPSRSLLVVLLALACGETKGGAKIGGTIDDAAPGPGQDAGPPGTRGGGGGAFGGGHDPDAAPLEPDADVPGADAPTTSADARPDRPRDLARDSFTAVDAVTMVDTGPAPDLSSDPCGATCDMYETAYKAALVRARACNPASKLQCQMTAATGLGCAGCKVWVTSTVELADLRAKWTDAGCGKCKILCPQIACRALTTGVCHSKMLAAPPDPGDRVLPPPTLTGSCIDQTDPVPF